MTNSPYVQGMMDKCAAISPRVMKSLRNMLLMGAGGGLGYGAATASGAGKRLGDWSVDPKQGLPDMLAQVAKKHQWGQKGRQAVTEAGQAFGRELSPVMSATLKEMGKTLGLSTIAGLGGTGVARMALKRPAGPPTRSREDLDEYYEAERRRRSLANLIGLLTATAAGGAYAYRQPLAAKFKGLMGRIRKQGSIDFHALAGGEAYKDIATEGKPSRKYEQYEVKHEEIRPRGKKPPLEETAPAGDKAVRKIKLLVR